MVSFLKLPLKFKQVIYLINKGSLECFFWRKGNVLITRFCTIFCLAYLNVSGQHTHLELLSEGRAGARWRGLVWGRAVTLPTFLEGIVDAAVQAVRRHQF